MSAMAGFFRKGRAIAISARRRDRHQSQLAARQQEEPQQEEPQETCPHCGAEHEKPRRPHLFRHPVYVCADCVLRAVDADGREVDFYNAGMSGGFAAEHRADGSPCRSVTESFVAYIDGKPYYADEMRFGGIVVQPISALPPACHENPPG